MSEETQEDYDDDVLEVVDPSPKTPDPSVVATEIMLAAAIRTQPELEPAARLEAAILLIKVPTSDWADLLCTVWVGRYYADKYLEERVGRMSRSRRDSLAVVREGATTRPFRDEDLRNTAASVWQGKLVLVFSPDMERDVPPDYLMYADHTLEIPALTAEGVFEVVTRVCGRSPVEQVFTGDLECVTPQVLQLAFRPGRTPDAYMAKLNEACRKPAARTGGAASPREEPSLDRLHGMAEATEWGKKLAVDIAEFKAGRLPWSAVDHGCLISGPPGVGKSLFARALARACGVPLILASHSMWQSDGAAHLGTTLRAIRRSFSDAKEKAPSILFIDEIDSLPNRATLKHSQADYDIQVVNAVLAELDGAASRAGVVVIGACNYAHKLDPALIRSGRLDRHIRIEFPDAGELALILREHLGDDLPGASLADAGFLALGCSGADCERIVRGARRRARVAERPMSMADLIEEIGGGDQRSEAALFLAAIHEAGHAYAIEILLPGQLEAVSLRRDGNSSGGVMSKTGRGVLELSDLKKLLRVLLSGRAAEEVFFGTPSSGAGGDHASDLARATTLAVHAATCFGFTETFGLTWLGQTEVSRIPDTLMGNPRLAQVVRSQLDEEYASALDLMRSGRQAIAAIATALVARRALGQEEVVRLIELAGTARHRQVSSEPVEGRLSGGHND